MNICPNCGAELKEGAAFCTYCGAPVAPKTAEPAPDFNDFGNSNTYSAPTANTYAASVRPNVVTPHERSIGMAILLSIVTCGFYGIYWFIKLNNETNEAAGKIDYTSGITVVLLTLVTCGIYGIYWYYKIAQVLDEALVAHGLLQKNNAVLFLILGLFGLGIVNYIILQDSLNQMAKTRN